MASKNFIVSLILVFAMFFQVSVSADLKEDANRILDGLTELGSIFKKPKKDKETQQTAKPLTEQEKIRQSCADAVQYYYDTFVSGYEYSHFVTFDADKYKSAVKKLTVEIDPDLKPNAQYTKNSLTGNKWITLREDPGKSKNVELSRSIYHEMCHHFEDLDGYMEADPERGETDEYIHKNTNYMEHVFEVVCNRYKIVEKAAKRGDSPQKLLEFYKNAREGINDLKKLKLLPNAKDMNRMFGFKFDPMAVENFYLNNSKYNNLRKAIEMYQNESSSGAPDAAVSLPPGTGYWKLIDTEIRTPLPENGQTNSCSNGSGKSEKTNPEGCKWSTSAMWTQPPSVILPDDIVKISVSLLIGEYFNGDTGDKGFNYVGADMSVVCDGYDIDFGFITAGAIRFMNEEKAQTIEVKGEWGKKLIPSASTELSAKLGSGSPGAKVGIKVNYFHGQAAGAKYIYEWNVVPN